jgi:2-polyprenyl-6-hydroxyphenyl methylase/3-demethylubiquinone-9 3-methyltransferase
LLPKGTHQYGRFIKPSELIGWARQNGFHCHARTGLTYHPIRREYSLTPNIEVNYLLHFTKQDLI